MEIHNNVFLETLGYYKKYIIVYFYNILEIVRVFASTALTQP